MHIIPIASGKGGVGKSLVAANLSIALAQAKMDVILADLDLGASNLHLMLGFRAPKNGIGTFLSSSSVAFEEIVAQTEYPNLRFIPGDAEIPGLANIRPQQKNQLVKRLLSLDADYLVLDLGAGTGTNMLDFFLTSGQGLVVTAPTVAATLNAYLFLKNVVFRLMYSSFKAKSPAYLYLESLRKDGASLQKAYIPAILEEAKRRDPESYSSFRQKAAKFRPRLVMNLLDDPKDADKAYEIRRSCKEYLSLDIEHLGILYRDELQDIALQSRMPIVIYKPQSVLSQAIYRIADKIIQTSDESDDFVSPEFFEDSFITADSEAESDYGQKMANIEELLHCGALSTGDLIETIKSQQYEIGSLKNENQLLKSKLSKAVMDGYQI